MNSLLINNENSLILDNNGKLQSSQKNSTTSNANGILSEKSSSSNLASTTVITNSSSLFTNFLIGFFFVTIFLIAIYLIFRFWKKNWKTIPGLYKIDEYRYSRLNQNEVDVTDSVVFHRDHIEPISSEVQFDEPDLLQVSEAQQNKPATLELGSNSLINLNSNTNSALKNDKSNFRQISSRMNSFTSESSKLLTLEEVSDEDLLQ